MQNKLTQAQAQAQAQAEHRKQRTKILTLKEVGVSEVDGD